MAEKDRGKDRQTRLRKDRVTGRVQKSNSWLGAEKDRGKTCRQTRLRKDRVTGRV
jgi:hypothetical protein